MKVTKPLLLVLSSFFLVPNILKANASEDFSSLDFSNRNSISNKQITASDLIKQIANVETTEAEKALLSSKSFNMQYDDQISSKNVHTFYDEDEKSLYVSANSYIYIANNGQSVEWIPCSAKLGEETLNFTYVAQSNEYELTFSNVNDDLEDIQINYESTFDIPKETANNLINFAYVSAKSLSDAKIISDAEYQTSHATYLENLEDYNSYLAAKSQYECDFANYQQYLLDKKAYDIEKAIFDVEDAKYQQYLSDKAQYVSNLNDYNSYLTALAQYRIDKKAYDIYVEEKAEYDEEYNALLDKIANYNSQMAIINFELGAMNLIKTSMNDIGRTIYSDVKGDTVTAVLDRQDELEVLDADVDAINDAGAATESLRGIFDIYFDLETDAEKYNFYLNYYSGPNGIRNSVEKLLRSLDKLYRSGIVRNVLVQQNKNEKYKILVAQLAVLANALDDEPVKNYEKYKNISKNSCFFDENWTIDGETIKEILDENKIYEDLNCGRPTISLFPTKPLIGEPPVEVANPGDEPASVAKPTAPTEVNEPTPMTLSEPELVEEPIEPVTVSEPIEPLPTSYTDLELALINEYETSVLTERSLLNEDYELKLNTSVNKKFKNGSIVTVKFFDSIDGNLLDEEEIDSGTAAIFEGILPTKSADNIYSNYVLDYWIDSDGAQVDLTNVTKDYSVYPHFKGTEFTKYTVKWEIGNNIYEEIYNYGETPSCKEDLIKNDDQFFYYAFREFDKEIAPVTQNITYKALFDETSKYYVTWNINNINYKEAYKAGETPICNHELAKPADFTSFYVFNSFDKEIVPITSNVTYTAIFDKINYVEEGGRSATISRNGDLIIIDASKLSNSLDVSKVFKFYLSDYSLENVLIKAKDFDLSLDSSLVNALKNNDVKTIGLEINSLGEKSYSFNLVVLDSNDSLIEISNSANIEIKNLTLDENHAVLLDNQNNNINKEIINRKISFALKANKNYEIKNEFQIEIVSSAKYNIEIDNLVHFAGDTLTITVTPSEGVELTSIYFVNSQKIKYSIVDNSFVMPNSDITISADYKMKVFYITFDSDGGNKVSTKSAEYNNKITAPKNPYKEGFVFKGWYLEDELFDFTNTKITQNITLKAKWEENVIDVEKPEENKRHINKYFIIIPCAIALPGAGVTLLLVLLKKKKLAKIKK